MLRRRVLRGGFGTMEATSSVTGTDVTDGGTGGSTVGTGEGAGTLGIGSAGISGGGGLLDQTVRLQGPESYSEAA